MIYNPVLLCHAKELDECQKWMISPQWLHDSKEEQFLTFTGVRGPEEIGRGI